MTEETNLLVGTIAVASFFAAGIWLTFFPGNVRDQALGKSKKSALGAIVHSPAYLSTLKASGSMAFIMCGFLAALLVFHQGR